MRAKIGMALVGVLIFVVAAQLAGAATAPRLINYQGRLTDSAGHPPADGTTVDLTFAFYGVASGGTAYLSVLQENVVITGGIYDVLIGSGPVTAGTETSLADVFQKHPTVYMGVKVEAEAEMTPRARIASAPFALATDLWQIEQFLRAPDFDGDGHDKNFIYTGDDCNDTDPTIFPGATDMTRDGIDQDCDGFDGNHCQGLADGSTCPGGLCCGELCRTGANCCANDDCGCGGAADPCFLFGPGLCMTQFGCVDMGLCFGPPGCEMYPVEPMCVSNGCIWNFMCNGGHMDCSFYDEANCPTQMSCYVQTCGTGYLCQ